MSTGDGAFDEEREFDWAWIKQARIRELSAHGRDVQARMAAGPPVPPRPPGLLKRLRFRLYLWRSRQP